jgi:hypothetical protein
MDVFDSRREILRVSKDAEKSTFYWSFGTVFAFARKAVIYFSRHQIMDAVLYAQERMEM